MRPDRLAKLHRAVDAQAGEPIRVIPYVPGGYVAGAADPSRPVTDLTAVVTEVSKVARTLGTGNTTGHNADLRLVSHAVKYTTSALPFALRAGDRVAMLARGGLELKVNGTDPLGTDRTVARLEPLPPPPIKIGPQMKGTP